MSNSLARQSLKCHNLMPIISMYNQSLEKQERSGNDVICSRKCFDLCENFEAECIVWNLNFESCLIRVYIDCQKEDIMLNFFLFLNQTLNSDHLFESFEFSRRDDSNEWSHYRGLQWNNQSYCMNNCLQKLYWSLEEWYENLQHCISELGMDIQIQP